MIRLLTAALMLGLFSIAAPARAQTDPLVAELIESLAAAVEAIEADPAEVAALEAEAAALEAEIAARQASLTEVRGRRAALETGKAARLAEAQRLWRQLGTFLMVSPDEPLPDGQDDLTLTKFSASDVVRHDYNASVWHPVEGYQSKMEPGWAFTFDAVQVQPDGSLLHSLTNTAAASIKWEGEKRKHKTSGHYIVEATFSIPPGVIANPLWLFSEGDPRNGGAELDFEYMDGRLEYNLHSPGGYLMKAVEVDLNDERCRWEIILFENEDKALMRVTRLRDGWTDSLEISPAIIADWKATRTGVPASVAFPSGLQMFPMTELWVANQQWGLDPWNGDNTPWSGKWVPLPPGETVDMTIHGYRFTP